MGASGSQFDSDTGAYAHTANIEELKEYCKNHRLHVNKSGAHGKAIKQDYLDAIAHHRMIKKKKSHKKRY